MATDNASAPLEGKTIFMSGGSRGPGCTGNFFIDEDVLAEEGITDLEHYRADPEGVNWPSTCSKTEGERQGGQTLNPAGVDREYLGSLPRVPRRSTTKVPGSRSS